MNLVGPIRQKFTNIEATGKKHTSQNNATNDSFYAQAGGIVPLSSAGSWSARARETRAENDASYRRVGSADHAERTAISARRPIGPALSDLLGNPCGAFSRRYLFQVPRTGKEVGM